MRECRWRFYCIRVPLCLLVLLLVSGPSDTALALARCKGNERGSWLINPRNVSASALNEPAAPERLRGCPFYDFRKKGVDVLRPICNVAFAHGYDEFDPGCDWSATFGKMYMYVREGALQLYCLRVSYSMCVPHTYTCIHTHARRLRERAQILVSQNHYDNG
jgi:hypothetical protein